MKVLHCISSIDPKAGGPANALAGLASAQRRKGAEVSILATYGPGADLSLVDKLRALDIQVELVGPVRGRFGRHPDLAAATRQQVGQADLLHIHALWEEVQHLSAIAARKQKKPYIFRPCGMLDPWSLSQSRWVKKIYMAWRLRRDLNGAAALHYTTAIERDLAGPLKLRPASIVEPNGVALEEFENLPPAGTFRQRYPQLKDRRYVLFLSRLHHKKGLELLVPAFAQLKDQDVMLVIAGPDSDGYQAKIQEMARGLGITDRVLFTGMVKGVERVAALAEAELFVLPSYQENFGIAVVEALAAGVPVVISDQVNIYPDVLEGRVGAVVPLDINLLAEAMQQWLGDRQLRDQAAARTREFVWRRYGWDQIAGRWIEHYQRLVS